LSAQLQALKHFSEQAVLLSDVKSNCLGVLSEFQLQVTRELPAEQLEQFGFRPMRAVEEEVEGLMVR